MDFCHSIFSPGFWKHRPHKKNCWWSALDTEEALAAAKTDETFKSKLTQLHDTQEEKDGGIKCGKAWSGCLYCVGGSGSFGFTGATIGLIAGASCRADGFCHHILSPGFWKHPPHKKKCWWSGLDTEEALAEAKKEEILKPQLTQLHNTQEEKVGGIKCGRASSGCLYCFGGIYGTSCRADGFCHSIFSPGFWKHRPHKKNCWWSALDTEEALAEAKKEETFKTQLTQLQDTQEEKVGGIKCGKAWSGCLYCFGGSSSYQLIAGTSCRADGFCHHILSPGFRKHPPHKKRCWWSGLDTEEALAAAKKEEMLKPHLTRLHNTQVV